jgi:phospholipid/cholesterol/gamma-HCH transport system ATP-binding protein
VTTRNGAALIEVSHVHTRFGAAVVHEDVSLDVRRGEVFAIAGGNGCGKSTLLREIILLLTPTAGNIRVFGRDLARFDRDAVLDMRRRCGVMFQHGALFSSLTVAENVAAPLVEHTRIGRSLIRDIVQVKIGLAGFPRESIGKFPNELSGGMRRRAALARAIALDPEILFLDEPTAGLDPLSAHGFDELVKGLRAALDLTIVMVTHDLDSLWHVADRVALLGEGKVLGLGTMAELARSTDARISAYFQGPRGRAAREQAWNRR